MKALFALIPGAGALYCSAYASDQDAAELSCSSDSLPYLDSMIGFALPLPDGFVAEGNPPTKFTSKRSLSPDASAEIVGLHAEIRAGSFPESAFEGLETLTIDHPKSLGLTIRHGVFEIEYSHELLHIYTLTRDQTGIVVNSVGAIDIASILDCLI